MGEEEARWWRSPGASAPAGPAVEGDARVSAVGEPRGVGERDSRWGRSLPTCAAV